MKKILFPILMIIFVAGGAIAGDFAKNLDAGPSESNSKESKKDNAKHGKSHKKKEAHDKANKSKKGGHDEEASASGKTSYLKFDRQFVVPVMTRGKIDALVIMNLNLELDSNAPENAYTLEPKLRDAITRELLGLSNEGVFGKDLTSAESYETLRRTLLSTSKTIIPDGVRDILILDIARQEQ